MKYSSNYQAVLTYRTVATEQRKIHKSSINGLFTVHKLLFDEERQILESSALISLKT
jgi:hypothetical protein